MVYGFIKGLWFRSRVQGCRSQSVFRAMVYGSGSFPGL